MLVFVEIFILTYVAAGLACTPKISVGSNSNPDLDGHIFIECEISTCAYLHMIVYEKTGIGTTSQWTPVYEGFNKTYYHALETGTNYTLEHRNDYTAFPTKHILNVQHLIIKDHGEWRCVVIDENTHYESNPMEVIVYVTPTEDSILILPDNPSLVKEQAADFVCLVDGIHPEPKVVWKVDVVEYSGGVASNTQHENGVWSVNNTIALLFDKIGTNVVSCIMKTEDLDPWLHTYSWHSHVREHAAWIENHIDIDVKEPAKIIYPQEDVKVTGNSDSSFTLNCIGYGYKPNITWTKDGVNILDNNSTYAIRQQCNSSFCVALLSPLPDPDIQCLDSQHFGVYTCIVSLEPPYQSAQISPEFNAYGLSGMCRPYHLEIIIGSIIIGLVILGVIVVLMIYCRKKRKNSQKKTCDNTASTDTKGSTVRKGHELHHNDTVRSELVNDDQTRNTTTNAITCHQRENGETAYNNPGYAESLLNEGECQIHDSSANTSQDDKKSDKTSQFDEENDGAHNLDELNEEESPIDYENDGAHNLDETSAYTSQYDKNNDEAHYSNEKNDDAHYSNESSANTFQYDKKNDEVSTLDEKTEGGSHSNQMHYVSIVHVAVTDNNNTETLALLDGQTEPKKTHYRVLQRSYSDGPYLLRAGLGDNGNTNNNITQIKQKRNTGRKYHKIDSEFDRRISDPLPKSQYEDTEV